MVTFVFCGTFLLFVVPSGLLILVRFVVVVFVVTLSFFSKRLLTVPSTSAVAMLSTTDRHPISFLHVAFGNCDETALNWGIKK